MQPLVNKNIKKKKQSNKWFVDEKKDGSQTKADETTRIVTSEDIEIVSIHFGMKKFTRTEHLIKMEKLARRWKRLTAKEVRDKAYKNKIEE